MAKLRLLLRLTLVASLQKAEFSERVVRKLIAE